MLILKRIAIGVLFGLLGAFAQGATVTSRIGLTEPAVNDQNWGTTLNNNFGIIDSSMSCLACANVFTAGNSFQSLTVTSGGALDLNNFNNTAAGVLYSDGSSGKSAIAIIALDGMGINTNTNIGEGELIVGPGTNQTFARFAVIGTSNTGTAYSGFMSTGPISASTLWSLPKADGARGETLLTDGSAHLSFGVTFSSVVIGLTNPFTLLNRAAGTGSPTSGCTINGSITSGCGDTFPMLGFSTATGSAYIAFLDATGRLGLGGLGPNQLNVNGTAIISNGTSYPTTGISHFQVMSSTTETYSLLVSSDVTHFHVAISTSGHFITSASTGPTISSCGTGPTIVGDDNQGVITVGSGVTTACTATFYKPWGVAPVCTFNDDSTTVTGDISSVSQSAIIFGFSATIGGGHIYYRCGCSGTGCR